MARPAVARIELSAFRNNYQYAKTLSNHGKALAVIKANGYGHGAVRLAQALPEADGFGVACIEEALELRESGVEQPITLLEGVFEPDELQQADALQFMFTVHSEYQLAWIEHARPQHGFNVWLKIDTGMHRLGFSPEDAQQAYARLQACPHVASIALMTHFARADEVGCPVTAQQLTLFEQSIAGINEPVSVANSPATLVHPMTRREWTRPGIMLYGSSPLDQSLPVADALQPVMTLESALIAIRDLPAGESIGYGARYTCVQPTRVGVVAMGYADGYPRHASDGTPVAVNGVRSQIIGRVSMDMLTVDLTHIPDAQVGSRVELWGKQILANEVAQASDTIAYQLFTGVTRRVPLVYG